jgi:uncharacterized protein (TIGR04222 family)
MGTFIADVFPSDLFLWPYVYWGIVGAFALSGAALAVWTHLPTGESDDIRLDLYETAALGSCGGVTNTAIVRLILLGALRLASRTNRLEVSGPLPEGSHPIEDEVYRSVAAGNREVRPGPDAEGYGSRLWALGLYPGRVRRAVGGVVGIGTVGLAFVLFFIMGVRWQHPALVPGGQPDKDRRSRGAVGCCMVATVATGFAGLGLGVSLARGRTRLGQTVLAGLRRRHPLRETEDLSLVIALYGLDPLPARGHVALKDYLAPPPTPDPNAPVV